MTKPASGTRSAIWRHAGRRAEQLSSADEVVRDTGWVFNNVTGDDASLDAFVAQGTAEVERWFDRLGLASPDDRRRTVLELGAGIGRMTAALTERYGRVIATDIDAGFLERCRETVSRHGQVDRLETAAVEAGRHVAVPDGVADVVFSYITLQHCAPDVALDLVGEAVRVVRPGGTIALNFRTWRLADLALWPASRFARLWWRLTPGLARRSRLVTRLGWQANRVAPAAVVARFTQRGRGEVTIVQSSARRRRLRVPDGVALRRVDDLNPAHWFLIVNGVHPGSVKAGTTG